MAKIRITLVSENLDSLNKVVEQIKKVATYFNMKLRGPIPLPRKQLTIVTRRTPCGDGSDTYEHWYKRISKRVIFVEASESSIRNLLRIKIPDDVFVKISL